LLLVGYEKVFQTNDLDFERQRTDNDATPSYLFTYSPAASAYSRMVAVSGWELASAAPLELPLSLEKLTDRRRLLLRLLLLLLAELLLQLRLLRGCVRRHGRGSGVRERHHATTAGGEGRHGVVEARGSDA
jgi:hypothetical protein